MSFATVTEYSKILSIPKVAIRQQGEKKSERQMAKYYMEHFLFHLDNKCGREGLVELDHPLCVLKR